MGVWRATRGLPAALAGIVLPLPGLQAALDVDELPLRQELAADLSQAVPGHARVVLGPLRVAAARYSFVASVKVVNVADCMKKRCQM